jgi:hypothetical protein
MEAGLAVKEHCAPLLARSCCLRALIRCALSEHARSGPCPALTCVRPRIAEPQRRPRHPNAPHLLGRAASVRRQDARPFACMRPRRAAPRLGEPSPRRHPQQRAPPLLRPTAYGGLRHPRQHHGLRMHAPVAVVIASPPRTSCCRRSRPRPPPSTPLPLRTARRRLARYRRRARRHRRHQRRRQCLCVHAPVFAAITGASAAFTSAAATVFAVIAVATPASTPPSALRDRRLRCVTAVFVA